MASISNTLSLKHGLSLWCPQSTPLNRIHRGSCSFPSRSFRRCFTVSASSFANENREFVIVGGGNSAGYAARTFVEHGMASGKLCIVSKEAYAPYERPALTKAYLFPLDKKPARLPGFHTCVGTGGERQTPDWYKEQGIEMLYEDPIVNVDTEKQTLKTNSGKLLKYGSLIIATGCSASRFPDKIGGNLPGVHYIRDVADADSLISSLEKAKKVVVVGGGYIGMEVAAATSGWNLDTTVIFPEDHLMPRLFTPSLAQKYEKLYQDYGVKFVKGTSIKNLEAGPDGHVSGVKLENGSTIEADTVVIGIGAKPAVGPFEKIGLNSSVGGIQVDGQFRTGIPGIFAIGDVAAFPLKVCSFYELKVENLVFHGVMISRRVKLKQIYDRISRVEHVDHARRSAQHCVKSLLTAHTDTYDYLPYFYSRVFEYEGSPRKVWWQFFGDNVGETVQIGNFDPKVATFWIDSGILKGVLLESGTAEEFQLLPKLARSQPSIDKAKLQNASSVEEALEIARASLQVGAAD
ncbi:monodehydroascorbate reductase, chloroplastic/mitochondrial isoform X2 [Olea europaea var. sylvestris]|nr:monodehydroascorbate reductase, chloroplastic/mitochondrial isoform X2 [Olea europaea var. sylvestris]XP_022892958.1 monodehydroascorbate reductase, chloroplastic/mitochondrial isoform X2 [Olea europaea var. sylvestris]